MGILDALGLIVGLLYLYYEYKANKLVWLLGVIMPINSMTIYFKKGLYADFTINIYYLIIAVYGYIMWSRKGNDEHGKEAKALPISHTPKGMYLPLVLVICVLWVILWWLLVNFTPSTVPIPDAFTTALSIVAYWMMARKYAEQWLAWLVVDMVSSCLYAYKGLVFYPILYGIYTVIAVIGYRKWCTMIPKKA